VSGMVFIGGYQPAQDRPHPSDACRPEPPDWAECRPDGKSTSLAPPRFLKEGNTVKYAKKYRTCMFFTTRIGYRVHFSILVHLSLKDVKFEKIILRVCTVPSKSFQAFLNSYHEDRHRYLSSQERKKIVFFLLFLCQAESESVRYLN
jgi:hypothetical protein